MRTLWVLALVAACGSKKEPAPKQTGSGSAVAAAPSDAATAKLPPLTSEQRADVKKHMRAGWSLQKEKRWAEAVPEFEAVLAIAPNDPRALSELGWSAMNAGDYPKARKAIGAAIKLAIDKNVKASSLYNLGVVLAKTGDKAGALRSFAASLDLRKNKVVEDEVKKLGGKPEGEQPFCAPPKQACDCIIADAFPGIDSETPTECAEVTDKPPPIAGFHVYRAKSPWGYGSTSDYLLDDKQELVAVIAATTESGRHEQETTLSKAEVRTIGGHQIVWIETTTRDSATYPTGDDGMETEDHTWHEVTICVLGEAKTRCPLRGVPTLHVEESSRAETFDGPIKTEKHETVVDISIADTGLATVKLVKGASSEYLAKQLGEHQLWK